MRSDLKAAFAAREVKPPSKEVTEAVRTAFASGRPYPERAELGEIVTAGWRRLFEMDVPDDERSRMEAERVLGDLVLKTMEVAEYQDRISAYKSGKMDA